MHQQTPSGTRTAPPPWQEHQPTLLVMVVARLGLLLLAPIVIIIVPTALLFALSMFSLVARLLLAGPPFSPGIWLGVIVALCAVALMWGIIALWQFVVRYADGRVQFRTTYPHRQPQARGLPYDVQFVQHLTLLPRQKFVGRGTLQFTPDGLVVQGYRTGQGTAFVANVAIVVARVLVYIGIPQFARQRTTITIPYATPHHVAVQGCLLKVQHTGTSPRMIYLYVNVTDGERLYRELLHAYPAAVAATGWTG